MDPTKQLAPPIKMSPQCMPGTKSNATLTLKQCDDCAHVTSQRREAADGVLQFRCEWCPDRKEWWVCRLCLCFTGKNTKFKKLYHIQRHLQSTSHQQSLDSLRSSVLNNTMKTSQEVEVHRRDAAIRHSRQVIQRFFPNGGAVADYFGYQLLTGLSGAYSLVIRANFLRCFDHTRNKIDLHEGRIDFDCARFHRQLTEPQSRLTTRLIRAVYDLGRSHEQQDVSPMVLQHRRVEPPRDFNEVVNRYTRSPRSIYKSLPIPQTLTVANHAYSNILECYSIAAANGNNMASISLLFQKTDIGPSIKDVSRSPRCVELASWARKQGFPKGTKIIPYILWRDDVEPNWTKSNRGSVWLFTVSFVGVGKYWNSRGCTFPLAIGKSNDSHADIERLVHETMRIEFEKPHLVFSAISSEPEMVVGRPLAACPHRFTREMKVHHDRCRQCTIPRQVPMQCQPPRTHRCH